MKYLTQQQVDEFHQDGYLVIPNAASVESCHQLIEQAALLIDELKPEWDKAIFSTKNQTQTANEYFLSSGDQVRVFMEEDEDTAKGEVSHRVNKLGHAMHDLDPVFEAFSHQPFLADIAEDIGFKNPGLLQSMYIFKQAKIGGEVNIHQDATFLYTNPISVVGFWFALQDATLENGCLWALPGGHKVGLKSRFHRSGDGTDFEYMDPTPLPSDGYKPLEVSAGTLVLLHGLLPHYSEANRSSNPRQAYAVHVIEKESDYPEDNWLQRKADFPLKDFHGV